MSEEITVLVDLERLAGTAEFADRVALQALVDLVEPLGGHARPVHPGTADADLAAYYVVEVADADSRDRLLETLRRSELVQAAYLKPPAEPP